MVVQPQVEHGKLSRDIYQLKREVQHVTYSAGCNTRLGINMLQFFANMLYYYSTNLMPLCSHHAIILVIFSSLQFKIVC